MSRPFPLRAAGPRSGAASDFARPPLSTARSRFVTSDLRGTTQPPTGNENPFSTGAQCTDAVPYGVQQPPYTQRPMMGRVRNDRRHSGSLHPSPLPAFPAGGGEVCFVRATLLHGTLRYPSPPHPPPPPRPAPLP